MLYNILCIDDNQPMLSQLKSEWGKYGVCLTNVLDVQEAIGIIEDHEYHLVEITADYVQKYLLPSIKAIRDATDMPIIIRASSYNGVDLVASLRYGADGYIPSLETTEEMIWVEFAHIRRYCASDSGKREERPVFFQGIRLDMKARTAFVGKKEIYLSRGEFDCLNVLLSHPGMVFKYDTLYHASFGESTKCGFSEGSIQSLIKRIRKKLGPKYSRHIVSVRGIGYKMDTGRVPIPSSNK